MNNEILSIQGLTKSYQKQGKSTYEITTEQYALLDNLTFAIPEKKITALIGGNGSGKTTLFNLISGLIKPNCGSIIFNDGKEHHLTKIQSYEIPRLGIGRLFQENHIFHRMTVLENMLIADDCMYGESAITSIFMPHKTKKIEKDRIEEANNIFNILFGNKISFWKQCNKNAGTLSYGQQKLLGLARLFMADYKLLLLDEPTAGVNPELNDQIADILKKIVSLDKCTILLIEHNLKFVGQVADYCCYLDKGKIEIKGTPEYVFSNEYVKKSFLGI